MHITNLKKPVAVLLAAFLLLQGVSVALAAGTSGPQFYRYIFDEQDADGNYVPAYYVDADGRRISPPKASGVFAADDSLPSAYDARTENIVTTPKYQSGSGSCWAFTSISCMETSMIKQGYTTLADTDYSEAHLAWFGQRQRVLDENDPTYGDGRNIANPFTYGGNWQISVPTLLRGSGVQLESNAPFIETRDPDVMMQMEQPESDRYVSYARLKQSRQTTDRDTAKRMLLECGSLYTNYYDDTGITNQGYNKTNTCYYQNAKTVTNHAVTIVGWDDNYPASNFNAGLQPSGNGAWLIKGSWSVRYGNGGYYWLSYYDPSCTEYVAFTAMPADAYDNIYQYDGAFCNAGWTEDRTSMAMANMFHAKGNELLTHVAGFNPNYNTTVKVQIYSGGTNYTLTGADPTANMTLKVSKTVQDVGYGYFTVELLRPLLLQEGETFTVVITLTNPNGTQICLPIEGPTLQDDENHTIMQRSGNVGESFVKLSTTWKDANNYNGNDYNSVPVKAMTRSASQPSLTILTMPDKTTYNVGETLDTAGLTLAYADAYRITTTVTEGYTCTPSVLDAVGAQTVTVDYDGTSTTFDVMVLPLDKTLSIRTMPNKTVYYAGELLDTTGLSLTYCDEYGVESTVTEGFACSPSAFQTFGTQTVTVTYNGLQTTFDVTVQPCEKTLALSSLPSKTEYYVGETLDTTGLSLTYGNEYGVVSTVTDGFTCAPTELDTVGTQTVTVTYDGLSVSFDVSVTAPPVQNGVLTVASGSAYPGQTVQIAVSAAVNPGVVSMLLHVAYDDDALELTQVQNGNVFDDALFTPGNDLAIDPYTVLWMDALGTENHAATGTLFTMTFRIRDTAAAGETPVVLTVDEGSTFDLALQDVPFTVQDGVVLVHPLASPALTIGTPADKLTYFVGETLDTTGLSLTYSDQYGETTAVTAGFVSTPATLETIGTQTVTVTYNDLQTTFDVTVLPREQTLTLLTLPDKMVYTVGETLDTTGLSLSYSNEYGVVSTVTEGYACAPSTFNMTGTQTVTVLYNTLTVTFDVTVRSAETPHLAAAPGSSAVIDEDNALIYGLSYNLTAESIDNMIVAAGGGSYRLMYVTYIGTGTEVQLLDSDGRVMVIYRIVVFGDVDGDGVVTTDDIRAIKGHVTGADEFPDGSAKLFAADVDGDGVVDMQDTVRIKGIISGAVVIDQATRRDVE